MAYSITITAPDTPTVTVLDDTNTTVTIYQPTESISVITEGTEVAGQGVPTGGTANQVLTKSTSTDYDTEWTTLDYYTTAEIDALPTVYTSESEPSGPVDGDGWYNTLTGTYSIYTTAGGWKRQTLDGENF